MPGSATYNPFVGLGAFGTCYQEETLARQGPRSLRWGVGGWQAALGHRCVYKHESSKLGMPLTSYDLPPLMWVREPPGVQMFPKLSRTLSILGK